MLWLSDETRTERPDLVERLEFRERALFASLIGFAGITTNRHSRKLDLKAADYSLEPSRAVTLYGAMPVSGKENQPYWQRRNVRHVEALGEGARVIPHRINTVGKLKEVWAAGVRGFEIDVVYNYRGDGRFVVGHNDGVMGTALETLLSAVPADEVLKIWFDVKNLGGANHEALLQELNRVDAAFQLKDMIVLESGWTAPEFKAFREDGWQTSFYLPTGRIVDALAEGDPGVLSSIAFEIAEQDVRSVSFDVRLYPFVKYDLEALLWPEVTCHAWRGPPFDSVTFETPLSGNIIFNDARVKTLLCTCPSPFHL